MESLFFLVDVAVREPVVTSMSLRIGVGDSLRAGGTLGCESSGTHLSTRSSSRVCFGKWPSSFLSVLPVSCLCFLFLSRRESDSARDAGLAIDAVSAWELPPIISSRGMLVRSTVDFPTWFQAHALASR